MSRLESPAQTIQQHIEGCRGQLSVLSTLETTKVNLIQLC